MEAVGWGPDVLGSGFEQATLALGQDAEGPVVATIVRALPTWWAERVGPWRGVDVLYVHGWSDYFFQTELARTWTARGARFYALDLRKYGRSLRPGQTPGYITSLDDYDLDIRAALRVMGHDTDAATRRRLMLIGHSTGGLTLTVWAASHPGVADALILNSPWLELQTGPWGREALAPLVAARARWDPMGTQPEADLGFYTRAQREVGTLPDAPDGWRPERGFPTHPGWLKAVMDGHDLVARGVDVGCPTLVLLSRGSTPALTWRPQMLSTDSVLVVDDIARAAARIAPEVTLARIDGALHDVFLSAPEPRAHAHAGLQAWVTGVLARA